MTGSSVPVDVAAADRDENARKDDAKIDTVCIQEVTLAVREVLPAPKTVPEIDEDSP